MKESVMNIKKVYISVLCIALSLCISISVFAEVNLDDFAYFADDGSLQYDMDSYYYAYAKDLVAHSGVDIDPFVYWMHDPVSGDYIGYNYDSFKADYDSAITALAPEHVDSIVTDILVDESADSDIAEDFIDDSFVDESEISLLDTVLEDSESDIEEEVVVDIPHQYVVNDLRSPPVDPSTLYIDYISCDYPYWEQSDSLYFISSICPPVELLDSAFFTLCVDGEDTVISGSDFSFIGNDIIVAGLFWLVYDYADYLNWSFSPGIYCYSDIECLRQEGFLPDYISLTIPDYDFGGSFMSGSLKSLVVSIFGEYTPVNTTALLMETVDNETTTTLVDVVASGMAGVDWEWCAGVFLFGIMLFCLFKLLGGILS